MMVECMAGKSGAINGHVHDATPFKFGEEEGNDAIDYFGKQLAKGLATNSIFSCFLFVKKIIDLPRGQINDR